MEQFIYNPENNQLDDKIRHEEAYLRAKKKVEKIVGFYWHLASYIIINIVIIFIIVYYGGSLRSFGTYSTAFFWGIGLLFHGLGVFGPDFLFGKQWEAKKIKEFMDKDKQDWQ